MFQINGVVLLISRVLLGFIFTMHGYQKLFVWGTDGVQANFEAMGVPAAGAAAVFSSYLEFIGGILLIIGLLVPLVSILLILNMIGAIIYAHWDFGFWNADGGYELPLALIAGLLAVGFVSTGPVAADYLYWRRREGRRVDA